uniref:Uncharacterized protein n=1 Tax=Onchocerca volvulus TaxID=6282 RepID=A0A8R1XQR0_ONCVO
MMDHSFVPFYRTIKVMSSAANFELNRRSKVLHWRDGKITPPFLAKIWEYISRINFTDDVHRITFTEQNWSPLRAILFGSEKPLHITGITQNCFILIVTSQNNHLKIFDEIVLGENAPFVPDERKGSPMNGMIIPSSCFTSSDIKLYTLSIKTIVFVISHIQNRCTLIGYVVLNLRQRCRIYQKLKNNRKQLKLAIVISGDDQVTQEKAENRALMTAQILRKDMNNMPICIVAQSDTREDVERKFGRYRDSSVLIFDGSDVSASTLVIDTEDEETLKENFLNWKKRCSIAVLTNANVEKLTILVHAIRKYICTRRHVFRSVVNTSVIDTFPDIELNSLRLLDGSSITGVNYQVGMESRFDTGPVYILIGFRKFGYDEKDSSEKSD